MIVVSDTTPLNYLVLIESDQVLPAFFGRVYAPFCGSQRAFAPQDSGSGSSVGGGPSRLAHRPGPGAVWYLPGWARRGGGYRDALEIKAERVLIDDRDASREAVRSGLNVVGTLNILEEAAKRSLLDIEQKTKELKQTNFRASGKLYEAVLERVEKQIDRGAEGPRARWELNWPECPRAACWQ